MVMLRCGFVRVRDLSAMLLTESKSGIVTEDSACAEGFGELE